MKFDRPGIIGYHAGGLKTDCFKRIRMIRNVGETSYNVHFIKPDGYNDDCWFISAGLGDYIEIDGIRYEGDALKTFCETFITNAETKKVIDSL